jgi:hypothetical protein
MPQNIRFFSILVNSGIVTTFGPISTSTGFSKTCRGSIVRTVKTDRLRIVLEHIGRRDARSGLTEIEVWAE